MIRSVREVMDALPHLPGWVVRRWSARSATGGLLPGVLPDLLVAAVPGPMGDEIGIAFDGAGWSAVARVSAPGAATLTLDDLVAAMTPPPDPVQVCAVRSGGAVHLLLAVRVTPSCLRAADGPSRAEHVPALLRAALHRARSRCGGLEVAPLGAAAAADAVTATVLAAADPAGDDVPVEAPRYVGGAAGAEAVHVLDVPRARRSGDPSRLEPVAVLDRMLASASHPIAVSLAVVAGPPGAGRVVVEPPLVRITARSPADLDVVAQHLQAGLPPGYRLRPLTFRHGVALAASLPLGRPPASVPGVRRDTR